MMRYWCFLKGVEEARIFVIISFAELKGNEFVEFGLTVIIEEAVVDLPPYWVAL
jgi:hypothetical protein